MCPLKISKHFVSFIKTSGEYLTNVMILKLRFCYSQMKEILKLVMLHLL